MAGDAEIPKLHGWITPEYAEEMIGDLYRFLLKVDKEKYRYGVSTKLPVKVDENA